MMEKRDILMTREYFVEFIELNDEEINICSNDILSGYDKLIKPELAYYTIYLNRLHGFIAKYSIGEDIKNLKNDYETLVESFIQYNKQPNSSPVVFKDALEENELSLWLLSLSLLLCIDEITLHRLLKYIGNEGDDALFEALVGTRIAGRKVATKLIYPKKYSKLLLAAQGVESVNNMKQYLDSWYKSMKDCYWYDNHKGPEGGGYFGYWCWEAAAVSVAFNIDDTEFRNMPYYPKDMADYSRALK